MAPRVLVLDSEAVSALAERRKGRAELLAMRAGALRSRAERTRRKKRDLTVDAIVAATAIEMGPSVVVTSDGQDLELLVAGFDVKVTTI